VLQSLFVGVVVVFVVLLLLLSRFIRDLLIEKELVSLLSPRDTNAMYILTNLSLSISFLEQQQQQRLFVQALGASKALKPFCFFSCSSSFKERESLRVFLS